MSEPADYDELASLLAEAAEHLRFEHEAGGIGLPWNYAIRAAAAQTQASPASRPQPAPVQRPVATSATPSVAYVPQSSPAPIVLPSTPKPAAQQAAKASTAAQEADLDALLSRAREARKPTAPVQPTLDVARAAPAAPAVRLDSGPRLTVLQDLASKAASCTACGLHASRTKSVFARGDAMSRIVFVGEGPGENEDKQGEPFVGAAGQLLDKMIVAMGMKRDAVYICNVVKCRPPENRTPTTEEASACGHFLDGQLAAIAPVVIVALGRCAAERLGCAEPGKSWRGTWGAYRGTPVMPTYHPAYLLRSPDMKRPVWEDLQKVVARLSRSEAP
jgi:uracil-DNA glycosylase family 4